MTWTCDCCGDQFDDQEDAWEYHFCCNRCAVIVWNDLADGLINWLFLTKELEDERAAR